MKLRCVGASLFLAAFLFVASGADASSLSKSYVFNSGVTLEIGVDIDEGLRLDSVKFMVPTGSKGKPRRLSGVVRAEVAVSNTGDKSRRVGIALAVFDESGRLLGVASGGSKLVPLKKDRQARYTLAFDDVNRELSKAARFQITVEPR